MGSIRRVFIPWDRPALLTAAEWLLGKQAASRGDLSQTIVVLPGRRSARRLIEILVALAQARGHGLSPPLTVTVGALPELLYSPKRPFADDLTQKLAWANALRKIDEAELRPAIPDLPPADDTTRWLQLADVLRRQHAELAADGLDFADMARETRALGEIQESRRWKAFRSVQEAHLAALDQLELWDIQTARLVAVDHRECHTEKQIVLLGTADMNRVLRQILDQVAGHVTAVVFAPEDLADRFDAHGCLIPSAWADVPIPVDSAQCVLADDPVDQADQVVRCLAAYEGRYRADQITVGLADESIVPQVERQLRQVNVACRFGGGTPITSSGPYRLCAAIANYLERRRFEDLAALVRHPDLYDWVSQQEDRTSDCVAELDAYQTRHVQARLDGGGWLGKPESCERVRLACGKIHDLLEPLAGRRPLGEWTSPLAGLLGTLYGDRELRSDVPAERMTLAAIEAVHAALRSHETVSPALMPHATAAEALRWALDAAARTAVPPPAEHDAVELLGWLELPLDDAPALVVTSLNEGYAPSSTGADLFLPDSLRRRLGLEDNARRYARDAYALSVLTASRESLHLIVGRRTAAGDPLLPSRLLFACDEDTLVERVQALFRSPAPREQRRPLAGSLSATRDRHIFVVPAPKPLEEPIDKLRATAFGDYLSCPYRFYLRHVLKLDVLDDAALELDGRGFGSLAHEVVARFGQHECRDSTSPEEIARALDSLLDRCARTFFGTHTRATVRIQVEQLRLRLHAFAQAQADWAREGWRIVFTEQPDEEAAYEWPIDGQPFYITGRIDRIDRNEHTGKWALLDYKSSNKATPPEDAHYSKRDGWTNLQLPLYRHLASLLGVDGEVSLGYITLPKDASRASFLLADWRSDDLQEADARATEVIRAIRKQVFWPPSDPPPPFSETFAPICMDGVSDRPLHQSAPRAEEPPA